MTVNRGDSSRVAVGTYRSFSPVFTGATPNEVLLGVPLVLPIANPGSASAQFSYAIQSSDMPVYAAGIVGQYVPIIITGGQNTTGVAHTVYTYLYSGSTAKYQVSASIAAGQYWTSMMPLNGAIANPVGTTYNVSMWADTASGINYDYSAVVVAPSRYGEAHSVAKSTAAYNFAWTVTTTFPTLSLGTPVVRGALRNQFFGYMSNQIIWLGSSPSKLMYLPAGYGFGVSDAEQNYPSYSIVSYTSRPYYYRVEELATVGYTQLELGEI